MPSSVKPKSHSKNPKVSKTAKEPKETEDSFTNILEKFFDYSSNHKNLDKLVQMDRYDSGSKAVGSGTKIIIAGTGTASASSLDGASSFASNLSLKGTVPSVHSVAAGGRNDGGDQASQYTIDDEQLKIDDGTANVPKYHRRNSHDDGKKSKTRGCCCCKKKKKKSLGYEDGDMNLLRLAANSATQMEKYDPSSNPEMMKGYPPELQQIFGVIGDSGTGQKPLSSVTIKIDGFPKAPMNRRARIPNRPEVNISLWRILRSSIGKDLTKLPLPVNFNEPLSMLQRLTEDYEYSGVLDKASRAMDSIEQMAYVAAFTVSSYASTAVRTGKPFNPLLGETFECDRMDDLGFRCICEQVSHHPPTAAQHCVGQNWVCWQEFTMSSSFRGNYLSVTPLGIAHLVFTDSGNHYTWRKVSTLVHNLILGTLWIDNVGEMEIFNHSTGDSCHLDYIPTSSFGGEQKRVEGTIINKDKQPLMTVAGYWDRKIESFDIIKVIKPGKYVLGPPKTIWTRNMPPTDSDKYYNFTVMACQLNEMEEGVAPTDSRRRPDQRLMENGQFDDANTEKLRLEEKQRAKRKKRMLEQAQKSQAPKASTSNDDDGEIVDEGEPGFQPAWFTLQKDPMTGKPIHVFKGEYWTCKEQQDWSRCPDIY